MVFANKPKLAPLAQEIAWAHNIIIMELRKELPSPVQIQQLLAEI
jgi:hypothetical protein